MSLLVTFRQHIGICLFFCITDTPALWAQAPIAPTSPAPMTLAQAFAWAHPPEGGVALAVGAEHVMLPKEAAPPPMGDSVEDVAQDFGLTTWTVGTVTAVAPATMVLLNDDPGDPAPKLNRYAALKMLAASLDDSQWQAFTSEQGLGLSDLTTPEQQQLFWALFPGHVLKVAPALPEGGGPSPDFATATDLSAGLDQVHIRLSQTSVLMPTSRGGDLIPTHSISTDPDGQTRWVAIHKQEAAPAQEYGQTARAIVPNAPKTSDLDYTQTALQAPVTLAGITTVGGLVTAVGKACGLELYADPHYAARTLTLFGNPPQASGANLLRAVAYCVTGTFRKVGPAYVLTDDLDGVGVLHRLWYDFEQRARLPDWKAEDKAAEALVQSRSAYAIPAFGDPAAATQQQEQPNPNTDMGRFFPEIPSLGSEDPIPFAQLTPGQQAAARLVAQRYSDVNSAEIEKDPTKAPNVRGNWTVEPQYRVEALVSTFPSPIQLDKSPLSLLFWSTDAYNQREREMEKWDKEQALKKIGALPSLAAALARVPNRAVLAAPHDAADLPGLIASMKALGLNQLWLSVFQQGVARVPGTPLPGPDTGSPDLLAAALAATKGTGIVVYPVLDLLTWGPQPPQAVTDMDILGQNSVQSAAQEQAEEPDFGPSDTPAPTGVSVSPFAPEVAADLTALIQKTVTCPGIGGLVWRATVPDGYNPSASDQSALGYTPDARLTFLRRFHADPWDIVNSGDYLDVDLTLPNWDDDQVNGNVSDNWDTFRSDTDLTLLRSLYGTARSAMPQALPILVSESDQASVNGLSWFGSWDDPRKPVPTRFVSDAEGGTDSPLDDQPDAAQAKAQSRVFLDAVCIGTDDDADDVVMNIRNDFKNQSWPGIVLDITEADGGPGVAGLKHLAGL